MRTSFVLAAAVSVLALMTVHQVAHAAEQRDPSATRIVVAMDNMGSMQQGPAGGGMPGGQGSGGTGGGMGMCCGMGGMSGSGQATMAPGGQAGSGAMPSGQAGQMGGSGMMNDNMRSMPQGQMGGTMPGMTAGGADMTDRIEGRIAFLKEELMITDAQTPAWNQFAQALRSSRQHLIEARQLLAAPAADASATVRLEQYERHLGARLEALKAVRSSFAQLYAGLDEHQKHVAEELVIPFLATF